MLQRLKPRRQMFCLFIVLIDLAASSTTRAASPRNAADFLDAIGINTHLAGSDDLDRDARHFQFVGIEHGRDSLFLGDEIRRLVMVHDKAGVKFDLSFDSYDPKLGRSVLRAALSNARSAVDAIDAVEGPNEPDWFGAYFDGQAKAAAVVAAQRALYQAVKADPVLAHLQVYCPALSYPASGGLASAIGDLSDFCQSGSSHPYTQNASLGVHPPFELIEMWTKFGQTITAPGRPQVITEAGWTTCPNSDGGVDEATQAKYAIAYLLSAFSLGVQRTYLYELTDDVLDPNCAVSGGHYGLFRRNGEAKLAATTLHNLHALLHSVRTTSVPLEYNIAGLDKTGHQLLLQRSDQEYVLGLWNDVVIWDRSKKAAVPQAAHVVKLTLSGPPRTIELHDPLLGSTPLRIFSATKEVAIDIADHPLFLLIRPAR